MLPTKRQKDLEDAIKRLTKQHGYAPSYDELAKELGVVPGAIRALVAGLIKRGRLRRTPRMIRSLELIDVSVKRSDGKGRAA